VVAAGHPLSARAGAEALARGGNATDAACAAAFAAAACESALTGPGAGGFLLARPPGGPATLLDFFVAVPGLDLGRPHDPARMRSFSVPFGDAEQEFHIGPASVAVPGMVAGLGDAAARLGRLPLRDLVAPAVALAREGVVLTETAAYLNEILTGMLTSTPAASAIYAPGGRMLRAGERIRLLDLADTLERLGAEGPGCMRDGELARLVVEHLAETGGDVTARDLAEYRVIPREPLEAGYRGLTIVTNPPPSSGGVLIAAALGAMEGGPPPAEPRAHYLAVARGSRHANGLRDEEFARDLGREGFLERFWARSGRSSRSPVGSTTHVSAVDGEGGMASLSSSNGAGSGVVVPGTGILLNNMLGEEDLNPGGFGRLSPGARMTSMMAPTLVLRDGEPVLAIGAAGSNRLRSAILQTLVSAVDGGLALRDAVTRPRVHHEGDGLDVEGGIPEDVVEGLAADGHAIRRWGGMSLFFGGVAVATAYGGAGDPRRGGAAAAVTRAGEVVDL
jgi:gamma-glutamyltranspeptidase / glutathione hydrolase